MVLVKVGRTVGHLLLFMENCLLLRVGFGRVQVAKVKGGAALTTTFDYFRFELLFVFLRC